MDPATLIIFAATQVISWAVGSAASWADRDAIRKNMANIDAGMSALRGAQEWGDSVAYIGNTYRGIAEKMINARKEMLASAVFAAERASITTQKLTAFRSALAGFVAKASPVIDQLKKEIEADELLMAQEQERYNIGETVIQPLLTGFEKWATDDPRRVITAYGASPDFPIPIEEIQFFISFYTVLTAAKEYIARLRAIAAQFFSDYQSQVLVRVTPDGAGGYIPAYSSGVSAPLLPLTVAYTEFVELSPQGIVTRDVSYTGDPAGLDARVSENVNRLKAVAEIVRALWDEEVIINHSKGVSSRVGYEQLAMVSGQADKLPAIERFRYLEQFIFAQAVPDALKEKVLSFYVFERDGVSMETVDAALAELAAFPAANAARWAVLAKEQCGDGQVYVTGAQAYAADGDALFSRVDGFIDAFVKILNERAAAIAADAAIGDIISGKAIYRNPAATKLVNANGTAPNANSGAGILAALAAFVLIQGV